MYASYIKMQKHKPKAGNILQMLQEWLFIV